MPEWNETLIWKELAKSKKPEAGEVRALLELRMPAIQSILRSGGTAPMSFTLHDAEHSFRVAEKMAEIVPKGGLKKLSTYELSFLLLSAYLHDIGMTPNQARVQRYWQHLAFGKADTEMEKLNLREATDFQGWLDERADSIDQPLAKNGQLGEEEIRLANELITYFARDRHNDWSEEWIRRHLTEDRLGSFEGWIEDLVRLCRSHHEGYRELVRDHFDPRPVGRQGEVLHLRYLACVLRIADILDVDVERTPQVVFQHRSVASSSVIYWLKDHDFLISRDAAALLVHARPRSAVIENAIRTTADAIRQELETCARISREKDFSTCSFRRAGLPHRWDYPETVQVEVRPLRDSYVYIDGAFRPDTDKLLELFSGTQLYHEPFAAVRELLQNAFDAVKEGMANERLTWSDAQDPIGLKHLAQRNQVQLLLEESRGDLWLTCRDSGAGMTREIIERHLLVSGGSRRPELRALERRCRQAGFELGRTGTFGIGVLSYFMIANRVEFHTQRSQALQDTEPHGWYFETEGVGSFGELRRVPVEARGTEVKLRLRREIVQGLEPLAFHLRQYLEGILLNVPCRFRFDFKGQEGQRWELAPGWQEGEAKALDNFLQARINDLQAGIQHPSPYIARSSRRRMEAELQEWEQLAERARRAIKWYLPEEGALPGGLGRFRVAIPIYQLPDGICRAFLNVVDARGTLVRSGGVDGLLPKFAPLHGWHGMGIALASTLDPPTSSLSFPFYCQIDWQHKEAGEISVDRKSIRLSDAAVSAINWLEEWVESSLIGIFASTRSAYADLNRLITADFAGSVAEPEEAWWLMSSRAWSQVQFPAIDASAWDALSKGSVAAYWQDKLVSVVLPIYLRTRHDGSSLDITWGDSGNSLFLPDRIIVASREPLAIVPFYVTPSRRRFGEPNLVRAKFPPSWEHLCGVSTNAVGMEPVWNEDHPIVKAVSPSDWEWLEDLEALTLGEGLSTLGRACAVVLGTCARWYSLENWREILDERFPGLWTDAWKMIQLMQPSLERVDFWVQPPNSAGTLISLWAESFDRTSSSASAVLSYLPAPGDEWTLFIFSDEAQEKKG